MTMDYVTAKEIVEKNKEYISQVEGLKEALDCIFIAKAKAQVEEITKGILDCNYGELEDDVYNVLAKYASIPFIINYKREKEYDLDDKEIDYLVRLMNNE